MYQLFIRRSLAIAGFAALALILWATRGYAPQRDKPEKISIDNLTWNSSAQVFLVEHSAQFGLATGGERAEFTIHTTLAIFDPDGNLIDMLDPQVDLVMVGERAEPDA